jgi:phage tail-like protein
VLKQIFKHIKNWFMGKYPTPAYHFIVQWGGTRTGFSEVSGLSIETDVIDYREGNSPVQNTVKIPGIRKFTNIVLKRGIVAGDSDFFAWASTVQQGQVERRDVVISLLNESHQPLMTWKVRSAWPAKYEGPVLRAGSSEVAIETLELAHEGIEVQTS